MGLVGFMALWVVVAFVAARVAPREAVA
jgi:hypothetical protein